jgi:hypothetical protein
MKYNGVQRISMVPVRRPGRDNGLVKERTFLNLKYLLYQLQYMW